MPDKAFLVFCKIGHFNGKNHCRKSPLQLLQQIFRTNLLFLMFVATFLNVIFLHTFLIDKRVVLTFRLRFSFACCYKKGLTNSEKLIQTIDNIEEKEIKQFAFVAG